MSASTSVNTPTFIHYQRRSFPEAQLLEMVATLGMAARRAYKFVAILVYPKVHSAVRSSANLVFDDILINSVLCPLGFVACIFCYCIKGFLVHESD